MNQGTWKHSSKIILLCAIGVGINLGFSFIAAILRLPIYLDCIGTLLVAILGGTLPAVIAGFISNVTSSLGTPLYLYYGFPTLCIAICAGYYAKKGFFQHWKGRILSIVSFGLIGSIISTGIGWILFSQQINGTAAPLAFWFQSHGIQDILAQLMSEIIYEMLDKSITVMIASLAFTMIPKRFYLRQDSEYRNPIHQKLTKIVVGSTIFVGLSAMILGVCYYGQLLRSNSEYSSQSIALKASKCVDGDLVSTQLKLGTKAKGYKETKEKLSKIYTSSTDIRYLYVCVIKKSGCYVLYDVDISGELGRTAGTYIKNDPDIYNRIDQFLAGGEIESGFGNNPYGTLLSSYAPIYNSKGETVAYACADVDLNTYYQKMWLYIVQTATFIIGIMLITIVVILCFIHHHISKPIQAIVRETKALEDISPKDWQDSDVWKNRATIETGDEIEELYNTVTNAEENVCINVRKQLETDEANRAKTDFLSRMSHDMRTPMNAIIGLSSLTIDDAERPDVVRDNMTKIRSSSDFLLGLVNDILDLAKIEDGSVTLRYEPYPYQEFIMNMETMFRAQCEAKNIQLDIQSLKTNPIISVDKMRINQIFFNIISNAVKYTPSGGSIFYSLENYVLHDQTLSVDFVVRDTGIGMTKEYQEHLFEPFQQENTEITSELQGSGLGLSITKQLVDLMHGTITIESEKNIGTCVTVHFEFLCIEEDAKEHKITSSQDDYSSTLEGKHVLLAEDHPLNAQIARRILEKKKMIVTHAENGAISVERFKASREHTFDIILMDIRMPEMSGLEAASKIRSLAREDAKTIPIIALSANAYPEDIKKSLDAGMNGHLPKPVEPNMLYETIYKNLK